MSLPTLTVVGNSTGARADPQALSCTTAGFAMLAAANAQAQSNLLSGTVLYLKSPNNHYWSVGIDNAGVVTYTDIGTILP